MDENYNELESFSSFYEYVDRVIMEASGPTYIIKNEMYPIIESVLSTDTGDKKFKNLVGKFLDKNSIILHKSGPTKNIPFGDVDKSMYYQLFNTTDKNLKVIIKKVIDNIGVTSEFKLLTNNPIFWVFYCCIRYYTIKKDTKGINSALAIYALASYPSVHSVIFPHGANEGVMDYTIEHLSDRFIIKQAGHLFGGLLLSIDHSYDFLKESMIDCKDSDVIRFIQRIRNDQKSMMKNICEQYMKNYREGNRIKLNKASQSDDIQFDDEGENNTTIVASTCTNITNQIIISGLDLQRVDQARKIAGISFTDCRYYLSKIIAVKYTDEIEKFIHSILFLYLFTEKKKKDDINSSFFLTWSAELFRKTNSHDENIKTIKDTLDRWGEETGVHEKFKREASRVNYKKAIFWYFILSIQYFNK